MPVYNKDRRVLTCGQIGRLMCFDQQRVNAGERHLFAVEGQLRLSPLRRDMVFDAKVDLFAFYVPHRHIYGDQWIEFLRQGVDGPNLNLQPIALGGDSYSHFGIRHSTVLPKYCVAGYNRIWNYNFRFPTAAADEKADDFLGDTPDERDYGIACGHLDNMWTAAIDSERTADDQELTIANNKLDITQLAKKQAQYVTEGKREWFADRYYEIMREVFGTKVNTDADQRPTLIHRESGWMSGRDIDGTDQASLGNVSGKSIVNLSTRFRPFFAVEHGNIFFLLLLRFAPMHASEHDFFEDNENVSYRTFMGDPKIDGCEPPRDLLASQIFSNTQSNSVLGKVPFGQWHRYAPSRVHPRFDEEVDGYPILPVEKVMTRELCKYVVPSDYDRVFQDDKLKHWNSRLVVRDMCKSLEPPVSASIFAGGK